MNRRILTPCPHVYNTANCRVPTFMLRAKSIGHIVLVTMQTSLGPFLYIATAWPLTNPTIPEKDAWEDPFPIQLDTFVIADHPLKSSGVTRALLNAPVDSIKSAYVSPSLAGEHASVRFPNIDDGVPRELSSRPGKTTNQYIGMRTRKERNVDLHRGHQEPDGVADELAPQLVQHAT